ARMPKTTERTMLRSAASWRSRFVDAAGSNATFEIDTSAEGIGTSPDSRCVKAAPLVTESIFFPALTVLRGAFDEPQGGEHHEDRQASFTVVTRGLPPR